MGLFLFVIIVPLFVILASIFLQANEECPNCNEKGGMTSKGDEFIQYAYCEKCGYTEK